MSSSEIESIVGSSHSPFSPVIPEKSKMLYEKRYKQFKLWCKGKRAKSVNESVLLSYLMEKSKTLKSSCLWNTYTTLKVMLNRKEGLNIEEYPRVVQFLRKKSLVLTKEHIQKFLEEADDEKYLTWKVVLIMGIAGGLKCVELANMTIDDIEDRDHRLIVTVRDRKIENKRSFTITNQDYLRIYRKYLALHPKHENTRRLFLKDFNGTRLAVHGGVQTIGRIPSYIANYLKLPNINHYTGYCFRVSSAALLEDSINESSKMDIERRCDADDSFNTGQCFRITSPVLQIINDSSKMDLIRRCDVNDSKQLELTNNSMYNCRFCLKLPQDTQFRLMSMINSAYFRVVLPEIDLTLTESPRICHDCYKNLESAYYFKVKCLETETQIKIINEENNKGKDPVNVKLELDDLEFFSSAREENNVKIDDKIQPKIEVITIDDDENEEEKERVVNKAIYFHNVDSTVDKEVNAVSGDQQLLPKKSKERYEKAYNVFDGWCKKKNVDCGKITEEILLAYFAEQAESFKPSSLWSTFSMLKSTIMLKHNVYIGSYSRLLAFLKKKNLGFVPKKTKVFSRNEVDEFLLKAPDREFLMMKVALIIGLAGACGCDELTKLSLNDIADKDDVLILKISGANTTDKPRTFVVFKGDNGINILLYRKYLALRPSHTPHKRLFVNYRSGKCSVQPVGVHSFAKIPAKVASYLGLPHPELYTGHCLRRTSTTLLVNGGNDTTLKRQGLRYANIAEVYIEDPLESQISIDDPIQQPEYLHSYEIKKEIEESFESSSNFSETYHGVQQNPVSECPDALGKTSGNIPFSLDISNVKNTTINVNISGY